MSDCFGGFLPFTHGKLDLKAGESFQTGGNLPVPEGMSFKEGELLIYFAPTDENPIPNDTFVKIRWNDGTENREEIFNLSGMTRENPPPVQLDIHEGDYNPNISFDFFYPPGASDKTLHIMHGIPCSIEQQEEREPAPPAQVIDGVVTGSLDSMKLVSPLVLDIDASSTIDLVSLESSSAVYFDLNNDGFAEAAGWITSGDGLLALDLNQDGAITNGGELFGDQTGYDNGFLALAVYDSNGDGVITAEDQVWNDLRVWVDESQNGFSEADELRTLNSLNITSINLAYNDVNYDISGNNIRQEGSFAMGGNSYDIVDVYFETNTSNSIYAQFYEFDASTVGLPTARGYGTLAGLYIAASIDSNREDPDSIVSLLTDLSDLALEGIFAANTDALNLVRNIMYRWAGVEGVSPTSRGTNVDGQELGFLEALMAQPFLQGGYYSNPMTQAGDDLTEAFAMAYNHFFATLVAQTAGGEVFTGDVYYDIATDSFEGITGLNLDVLEDLEDAAALLSTTAEKEDLWINVVRMIEYTVGVDNLDGTSLTALEDAIDAAGSDVYFLVDSLVETPSANLVNGTPGVDDLDGTGGRDIIDAGSSNDTLDGLAGIDELYGDGGDDTLIGGGGDDFLVGSNGNDTYIYNLGDGLDVIDDGGSDGGDKIVFGAGIDAGDLTFTRAGELDLIIDIDTGTQTGQIILANQFHSTDSIETIEFDDTTTLDLTAQVYATNGTAGDDELYGVTTGGSINDVIYAGAGNDFVYSYSGDDTLYGEDGNDKLYGREGDDAIYGGDGNDLLDGYSDDDALHAGAGDDTVKGGSGNDTYHYTSGHDTYIEHSGADEIFLAAGYTSGSTDYYKVNSDLQILLDEGDTITISGFFSSSSYRIETLHFDGGPSVDLTTVSYTLQGDETNNALYGTAGADTFYGMGGDDTLDGGNGDDFLYGGTGDDYIEGDNDNDYMDGGAGDDYIYGGWGDDTYVYVSGHDEYQEYGGGNDIIEMAPGWTFEDVTFRRYSTDGNALVLEMSDANSITLYNQFNNSTTYKFETLLFSDLSSYTFSDYAYETYGTSGNDTYIGGITSGGSINDTIYGLDGDDGINGLYGDDALYGGDGNDTLHGGSGGNDYLDGGAGDDVLTGGNGDDTYFYESGHDSFGDTHGTDTIVMDAAYTFEDLTFRHYVASTADLTIEIDGSNSIIIENQFWSSSYAIEYITFADLSSYTFASMSFETHGTSGNDSIGGITVGGSIDNIIYGFDGNDVINSGNGDDYIDGGDGNDSIDGGNGNDTFFAGAGDDIVEGKDGNDTFIYTSGLDTYYESYSDTDKLFMSGGITINDITTLQSGNDAKIIVNSSVDEVTIYRQHYSTSYQIETIEFDDGFLTTLTDHLSWDWGTSGADSLTGTSSHDTIIGMDGNDTLDGAAGADNIHGGSGNDTIHGGDSSDLLHGSLGDDILFGDAGADTIFGGAGADIFTFEAATAYSGIDIIKDFSTGDSDVIDIADVLDGIYDPMSDVLADFVQISESSGDTLLSVDQDGTGTTYGWTQIASIQGVTGLSSADDMITAGQLLVA